MCEYIARNGIDAFENAQTALYSQADFPTQAAGEMVHQGAPASISCRARSHSNASNSRIAGVMRPAAMSLSPTPKRVKSSCGRYTRSFSSRSPRPARS